MANEKRICSRRLSGTEQTVTLQELEEAGVFQIRDLLNDLSTQASVQLSLEQTLARIASAWADRGFVVKPFEEGIDAFIIRERFARASRISKASRPFQGHGLHVLGFPRRRHRRSRGLDRRTPALSACAPP